MTKEIAVFREGRWSDFLVAERPRLHHEHVLHGLSGTDGDAIILRLVFDDSTILCGERDLSRYRNNWPTPDP